MKYNERSELLEWLHEKQALSIVLRLVKDSLLSKWTTKGSKRKATLMDSRKAILLCLENGTLLEHLRQISRTRQSVSIWAALIKIGSASLQNYLKSAQASIKHVHWEVIQLRNNFAKSPIAKLDKTSLLQIVSNSRRNQNLQFTNR